jgi:1-phosphofructokinase family hexose kinase
MALPGLGRCGQPHGSCKTRGRVLIAGPNLTIDRTARLEELRPGEVQRFDEVVVTPGGKGVDVARTARALDHAALLVGFVPGVTGRAAAALIEREGVALRGVACGGEIRSTAIVLELGGRVTVLNEPGPELARGDWDALEAALAAELPRHGVLVCSGSVPPGSPRDAYARLTALARGAGRRCVVDAGGATLAAALAAGPDVVCPNVAEAELALADDGAPAEPVEARADARPRALAAATALVERGARAALVTAAAAGAALARAAAQPVWVPAPAVATVRNPIGAGDALVGGLAAALERGATLDEAALHGVAAAAASVELPTAGDLDPARARELLAALASA